jgi:hypothetical protein
MVVLQGTCLYVLLRSLSVRARDAAAVAALALTFPFSDSLWLWGVLSLTSLAISAALIGLILAPRALRSSGRRALALHTASLALYVGSILGAPASVGPGVPVLDTTLDLSSAMRISYSDPQLTGVPIGASASIACGTRGPLVAGVAGIYGDAYLLDISDRRAIRLLDRRQCIAAARVSAFA